MNTDIDYKKLYEFSNDLNKILISCDNNVEFRSKCLKLIQKHFNYQHISFNIYDIAAKVASEIKLPCFDNVTLGLSKDLCFEYYRNYYKQDFLVINNRSIDIRDIIRICDVVSYDEYERSGFYKNLYKRYGLYFQVGMGIFRDQKQIGTLSLLRGKDEGEFSDKEVELFYLLRDVISQYLVNYLHLEFLNLEIQALKAHTSTFPIGHIVIDNHFNVTYANPIGEEYVLDLTGMPLDLFKYFYVNNIQPKIGILTQETPVDKFIELQNYYLRIEEHQVEHNSTQKTKQFSTSIYIEKKFAVRSHKFLKESFVEELTQREIEVIELMRQGLKNAEIANALHLSENTVKAHIHRIYGKVGVNSKTALLHKLQKMLE